MRVIPGLVFFAMEHPVARAYLEAMLRLGMMPERTVLMESVPMCHAEALRSLLRQRGLSGVLAFVLNRTASAVRARLDPDLNPAIETLQKAVLDAARKEGLPVPGDPGMSMADILNRSGVSYRSWQGTNMNDESFVHFVRDEVDQPFGLYVGGGILRERILSHGVRFIHIHPGVVPDIKGSRCLLWSVLTRGQVGLSCFFMNKGIDTGDLYMTREYPVPKVPVSLQILPTALSEHGAQVLDAYLDPWYRGAFLEEILGREPDPSRWQTYPQNPGDGRTYYMPHRCVMKKALASIYVSAEGDCGNGQ